jgi:hypothetical protein
MWPRFGLKNSLKVAANQAEINSNGFNLTLSPIYHINSAKSGAGAHYLRVQSGLALD